MTLLEAALYWRSRLEAGKPIYRVRVRRLLELAGAERRGLAIANTIRETLTVNGLTTEPDFQSGWIDSFVKIKLVERQIDAESPTEGESSTANIGIAESSREPEAAEAGLDPGAIDALTDNAEAANVAETLSAPANNEGLVETVVEPQMDPVARISSIPAANRGVTSVLLDDPINTATTRMIFEGYSQLAIMQGQREVRGMISWESIAKRSLISPAPRTVGDCRVDAQVIDAEGTLFDALPTIEEFGYVLVRSKERTIAGIVTASDLTAEFGRLSYAFMSIRAIEVLIRTKLHQCLGTTDLHHLEDHSKARCESDVSLLTFGENVTMLERPEVWSRVDVNVDKAQFLKRLLEIRDIRNDVMHFDPDPLSETQRTRLKQMEDFLRQVFV